MISDQSIHGVAFNVGSSIRRATAPDTTHAALKPVIDFKSIVDSIDVHRMNAEHRKMSVHFDRILELQTQRRKLVRRGFVVKT
jgi:hypothetical protein